MKHYSRSNIYANSTKTLMYKPAANIAYSYAWYVLFKNINGKNVLNTYNYSSTTSRHIWILRNLLRTLNVSIDVEVQAPKGLQNIEAAIELYEAQIVTLKAEISNPRSKPARNVERAEQIKKCQDVLTFLRQV